MRTDAWHGGLDAGVSKAIKEVVAPNAAQVDAQGKFPDDSIGALAEVGLLRATVPETDGGLGLPPPTLARLVKEVASACASTAMVYVMHLTALSAVLQLAKGPARQQILERVVEQGALFTEAISEPGAGSQWWSVHSTAEELPGDGFRLNARKSFCTSAGHADMYVVSTRTPGQESDRSHAIFLVDARTKGISASDWNGLGLRGNMSSGIEFDCEVPENALVAQDAEGGAETLRRYNEINQPIYHLGVGAAYTGISRAALDALCTRVSGRTYQGTPSSHGSKLRDYPIAQRHIGSISATVLRSEALLDHFARRLEEGHAFEEYALEMTAVKSSCAEAAVRVASEAMMAAGGTAYVSGLLPIERQLRDALAAPLMGPNNDFCKELMGRLALGGSYHDL